MTITIKLTCKKNDSNDKLEFTEINGNQDKKTIEVFNKYLNKLNDLKKNIMKSNNPDEFLSYFNNDACQLCNEKKYICKSEKIFVSNETAINRLYTFQNGIFHTVIKELEKLDFGILIAGSSGFSAVMKRNNDFKGFEPNDMDVYIKNISSEKIKAFESAIKSAFPNDKILVIRRPLTLTWWIIDEEENYKTEIQLNILHVKSWSEVFVMYHGDFVSIGYDVKLKKLVVLTNRWYNFVESYPRIIINNLNNYQNANILQYICNKYTKRGLECIKLEIDKEDEVPHDVQTSGTNDEDNIDVSSKTSNIYTKLIEIYGKQSDFIISDSTDQLYNSVSEYEWPKFIELNKLYESSSFVKHINDFEYPDGLTCPVTLENYNIAVVNRNCTHEISLKAYLLSGDCKKCPICRSNFEPLICNSLIGKPDIKLKHDVNKLSHKYKYKSIIEKFDL